MSEQDEIEAQPKADSDDALRTHIATLERQLAEAQGKLDAVQEWYAELGSWGHLMLPGLDAILKEE